MQLTAFWKQARKPHELPIVKTFLLLTLFLLLRGSCSFLWNTITHNIYKQKTMHIYCVQIIEKKTLLKKFKPIHKHKIHQVTLLNTNYKTCTNKIQQLSMQGSYCRYFGYKIINLLRNTNNAASNDNYVTCICWLDI